MRVAVMFTISFLFGLSHAGAVCGPENGVVIPASELQTGFTTEYHALKAFFSAKHPDSIKAVTLTAYRAIGKESTFIANERHDSLDSAKEKASQLQFEIALSQQKGCIAICRTPEAGMEFKALPTNVEGHCQ